MFCRQKPFSSERLSEFQRRPAQEIYVVQPGDRLLRSVNFLTVVACGNESLMGL